MFDIVVTTLRTLNQIVTAGVAITAFSLLLYALSFNLRDRVARSFALILACVVIVFVGDSISSIGGSKLARQLWLQLEWVGITILPAAYLHFSDALLTTTGRPSRGRRRLAVRLIYLVSLAFLATLPFSLLVGPLVPGGLPAPHLRRTPLTLVFTIYYLLVMVWALINFVRAYRRTVARASRRRMGYLLVGSLAPALGSYPYLLFGYSFAAHHELIFWLAALISNIAVSVLLILMAYAVAFFGVPWPDRVVKRRLAKWLLRGPVTACTVLALTTLARRAGQQVGLVYSAAVPIIMVATILVLEHIISLTSPIWERWVFPGEDRRDLETLQKLEERLLTTGDLRQFLEAVLAALCDRLRSSTAFIATLAPAGFEALVTIGNTDILEKEDISEKILEIVHENGEEEALFILGDFWFAPLYTVREEGGEMLGLLGVYRQKDQQIDPDQKEAVAILIKRAALALEDRLVQSRVFSSLEEITPDMEMIQSLRASARYDSGTSLIQPFVEDLLHGEAGSMPRWVKDALTHYWGGPKLTQNPLLKLRVVQQALAEHEDNPTNALRAILRMAVDQIRPDGERRFTGEWILFNILELKFMEGRSVREVARRLAMSEADLYRKQRVAVEAVARALLEMEEKVTLEIPVDHPTPNYHDQRGGLNGK